MPWFALCLTMLLVIQPLFARTNYTGYSGAPGRQTCASSCHGQTAGTVVVSGFPANYTPGQIYEVTVSRASGSSMNSINASCRVGTGSTNAGTLSAGAGTVTYNTSGETNGIKLSPYNANSAVFDWTAPIAGTGQVRLYVAAYQGTSRTSGRTTAITVISEESTVTLPGAATAPAPADQAANLSPYVDLSWTAGANATSHTLCFGTANPPDSLTTQTETTYAVPVLAPGTTYYWRVNERNDSGVTEGPVWRFSTLALPAAATQPSPADNSVGISEDTSLSWTAGSGAAGYDLYFGLVNPPPLVVDNGTGPAGFTPETPMLSDTDYYWRVDSRNAAGVTAGPVWHFRTQPVNGAGPRPALPLKTQLVDAYPNPFNARATIRFELAQPVQVQVCVFNLLGEEVARLWDAPLATGPQAIALDGSALTSGVYVYTVDAGGTRMQGKIVLLR